MLADKTVKQTPETINNLVIVEVKPEWNQTFREVVIPEMKQSISAEKGVLATNLGLLRRMKDLVHAMGKELATPDEARELLSMPGKK